MDTWAMFCEMCKIVSQEQNVFLDVKIDHSGVEMMLMPEDDDAEDDDQER